MGTLLGHVVPGTFFILFPIWWGYCLAIKHYHIRYRRRGQHQKPPLYQSSTTFSCICCSSGRNRPIESQIKIFCSVVGILGEFITGFGYIDDTTSKKKILIFGENNVQHITMFLGFALASLLEVLVHRKYPLPDGIEFLGNIFAYGLEAFLFHFHLHGRDAVDIHVHTLLLYSILLCTAAAIWEYNRPHQILATYGRIAGTFLQGAWFYAIGFILYFPSNNPYWIWLPTHGHLLLLTILFMFLKKFQLEKTTKTIPLLLKRTYNMKKLDLQAIKNPQVQTVREKELHRRQQQGILERLVKKRTGDYNEYFSQSSDSSVLKQRQHRSYDHIGQKRAIHLSKILRAFVADRIGSGEIGDILSGKNFQLTNIVVPVDLNRIEILWWSPEQEVNLIEDLLKTAGEELKTAIRHAQLLPNLPPVIFKRDNTPTQREKINNLLDVADTGRSEALTPTTTQRQDLYDSDRTTILRKLSVDESKSSNSDDLLNVDQLQRRMKAFALTKRMKRVREQRSATYGIMAIEKERQNREHFALNVTEDDEFEQIENKNKK
ncbi:unnamed protein product [Adineta ricciae]|uniref:Uncharacterized protein n=1 Tax=Adineta ricciae TaxID=249248 RepID=A0A814F6G3_ADIRI|nr:unnamed protein product [Adineta ricciae]